MKNHLVFLFATVVVSLFCVGCAQRQPTSVADPNSLETAKLYYKHGLNSEAKQLLIGMIGSAKQPDSVKAESLYWLGQIVFDEGRYSAAIADWQEIALHYPNTQAARDISGRLDQLREIVGQIADASATSLVAQSYLKNGDFWSDAVSKFTIDASWLPRVELANQWYDRIISEFPKSGDAEKAYARKMFTLLGWREIGEYGDKYGFRANPKKYMPTLIETFSKFETDFPSSGYLQGFRYQIAQAYWVQRQWDDTRTWLQKVLDSSTGEETFYSATARARLAKIEY